ncbi:MAG: terpene cyclase/mutase family protein [Akkermansiaceae bacterium]|nr:terpene cyclase/mutase family protein [Akkermansiaceae bacterium]NNM27951.1 terpene cyclase/mutase family protein [Akkermansiaceae bacterium]
MSLHAQLSPEAEARLRAQKRNSTISSIVISILVIVLCGLILAFIALKGMFFESPTIVAYSSSIEDEQELEERRINDQVQRKPSAPSSSMAKVIAASTVSPTAVPVPEFAVPEPSVEFGSGDDFGAGWGSGGDGGGGGFGNIPAAMRKRCTKEDRLARLSANGGNEKCEDAVVEALRFLQKTQNKDGSWDEKHKVAMTGLVLLAYLGHCETPLSEEFGLTVTAAITFLVDVAVKNKGKLATNYRDRHWCYEHAIATYAISEALTFCTMLGVHIPNLQEATQDAVQWIINNQHKSGGWDYGYSEDSARGGDLSIAAWQMQALKAGHTTGLELKNYRSCITAGLKYVRERQGSNGAFAYTGNNGRISLTGAGVLCIQQHKGAADSDARKGVKFLEENSKFDYTKGPANLYEHYYSAQAMINAGGKAWRNYNKLFRDNLLDAQLEDGSWPPPAGKLHVETATYRTALCTLMLEVYYRFLPGTGQKS